MMLLNAHWGIRWNVMSDELEVSVEVETKPPTRRGFLSVSSQIFDPLGIVSPAILPVKLILRDLCDAGLGWDDEVVGDERVRWEKWLEKSPLLSQICVPRCYKQPGYVPINTQLHCFCDASRSGYGSVAYLRMVDADGRVCVSFLKGVSRVSPKRPITIPRLELTAAVLAAEMSNAICKELEIEVNDTFFWTDSMTVIQFLNNQAERFKTFVANRIAKIHLLSKPDQWHHVESKLNPADIASRGLMPDKFLKADLWFNGPEFLSQNEISWPMNTPIALSNVYTTEMKVNSSIVVSESVLNDLLTRFSTFEKLQSSFAWLLRFKQFMKHKYLPDNDPPPVGPLTAAELSDAVTEIVRITQENEFPNAMSYFKNRAERRHVPSDSKVPKFPFAKLLAKLDVFVDRNVLRVGGRLRHSHLPIEQKYPLVLPPDHHVTDLIVEQSHRCEGHSGTLHVLSLVRKKFWILKGQSCVRRVLSRCHICKLKSARAGVQEMAPLPRERLTTGRPPFVHTSVDFFGPLFVKSGRSQLKRYGCIFTCLCTRAVHLELVESLDTPSFLNAFSRFTDRRGRPVYMFSDNATNFVGAKKLLVQGMKNLDKHAIHKSLAYQGIQWEHSPPASPHQNGVTEVMVREAKKLLQVLAQDKPLTDFSLMSLFTGIERILNDRPLTPVSDDHRDLETLSPSSILLNRLDPAYPPDRFLKSDEYRDSWRRVQRLLDLFWQRWSKDYLPLLQKRQKWLYPKRNFEIGDMVLIRSEDSPRSVWPKAVVEQVYPDKDGLVRRVKVRTATSTFHRDIRKLCLLELE